MSPIKVHSKTSKAVIYIINQEINMLAFKCRKIKSYYHERKSGKLRKNIYTAAK